MFGARKRGAASQYQAPDQKKMKLSHDNDRSKKHTKSKHKKSKHHDCQWSVSVTEVSEPNNDQNKTDDSHGGDEYSEFISNSPIGDSDPEDHESDPDSSRRISGSDRSAIASFLPPQQLLWTWSDDGHKLSTKARKVYHDSIEKDDESMKVGDCAVFLSTGRPDRPYIGRIDSMWETVGGGMRVRVRWFYHQAEVEGTAVGGGRVEDIKTEGALFSSSHYDENDVQTISHKCQVMSCGQFHTLASTGKLDRDGNDEYYLAGEYDPVEGTIVFAPEVFG